MRQLRETRIQRMLVTFRYKKYLGPISVGLRGISNALVTAFCCGYKGNPLNYL